MEKNITVREKKSTLYAVRFFALLFAAAFAVCAALAWGKPLCIALAALLALFLLFWLFLETRSISFSQDGICRKTLFFGRTYSWRELKEAKKYYSLSESGAIILLVFESGRRIRFRLNDQNGGEAERLILKHCNIKDA